MHMFLASTARPSRHAAKQMMEIARRHDANFVEAALPDGYRRWFTCENMGSPFDESTAKAVRADLAEADLLDADL